MLDLETKSKRESPGPFFGAPVSTSMTTPTTLAPRDAMVKKDDFFANGMGIGMGMPMGMAMNGSSGLSGAAAAASLFQTSDEVHGTANSMFYVDPKSHDSYNNVFGLNSLGLNMGFNLPANMGTGNNLLSNNEDDGFDDEFPEAMEDDDDDDEEEDGNEFDVDWLETEDAADMLPFDQQVDYYSILSSGVATGEFSEWKQLQLEEQAHLEQQRTLEPYQLSIAPQQLQIVSKPPSVSSSSSSSSSSAPLSDDVDMDVDSDGDLVEKIQTHVQDMYISRTLSEDPVGESSSNVSNSTSRNASFSTDMSSINEDERDDNSVVSKLTAASRNTSTSSEISEASSYQPESDDEDFVPHASGTSSSATARLKKSRDSRKKGPAGGSHKCDLVVASTGQTCGKMFSRPYDLVRHQDTIHAAVRKTFTCEVCPHGSKTFSRMDALSRHMRVKHAA